MTNLIYIPGTAEIITLAALLIIMTGLLTHLASRKK